MSSGTPSRPVPTAAASAAAAAGTRGFPCELALPCTGTFNLTACATLPGYPTPICSSTLLGRNDSSWAAMPWQQHDLPVMVADK